MALLLQGKSWTDTGEHRFALEAGPLRLRRAFCGVEQEGESFLLRVNALSRNALPADAELHLVELTRQTATWVAREIPALRAAIARSDWGEAKRMAVELRTAAAEVTEQYPEFDQNSAEVDMGLTEEVLALRDSLIDRGEKPAAALRRAAKLVALENGITARGKADLAKPPVQSKPKDVAKQIAKATQTPGRLKGEGAKNKEVKLDIMKLSDDQFGKLSRDALAKARGDFF
jgi:hypothetical protein